MALNTKATTVSIASAGTTTPTITLDANRVPLAIEMPSAFTGTTITFKAASRSSGTPVPLYFESTLYSLTVGASRHIALDREAFDGVKYLQIVSGSAEAAGRDLILITGE